MKIHSRDTIATALVYGLSLFVGLPVLAGSPSQLNSVRTYSYPGGNLVSNGSFESGAGSGSFKNWYEGFESDFAVLAPINAANNILPFEGRSHAGYTYQTPTTASGKNRFRLLSDFFVLKPGAPYTLFYRYQARNLDIPGGETIKPSVHFWGAKNFAYNAESKSFDFFFESSGLSSEVGPTVFGDAYQSQTSWILSSLQFTAPEEAYYGNIFLLCGSADGAKGDFYFDNVYLTEGFVSAGAVSAQNHPELIGASTKFLDGNNRILQSVVQDGTRDIVTQSFFDNTGRVKKTTLPMGGDFPGTRHGFVPDVKADHLQGDFLANFYNRTPVDDPSDPKTIDMPLDDPPPGGGPPPAYPEANGFAYSETNYEPSGLGRVLAHSEPGAAWKMGAGRNSKSKFSYSVDLQNPDELPVPSGSAGQFFVQENSGLDGEVTRDFLDKSGKLVRRSSKLTLAGTTKWLNTDFAYDDNGNLIRIEAPQDPTGNRLTQDMGYNALNQLTSSFSVATGMTKIIYDKTGNPRFSMSAKQEFEGRFTFIKYDEFGRVSRTGEITGLQYFNQVKADLADFPCSVECLDPATLVQPGIVRIRNINQYDGYSSSMSCMEGAGGSQIGKDIKFLGVAADGRPVACSENLNEAYTKTKGAVNGQIGLAKIYAIHFPGGTEFVYPDPGSEFSALSADLDLDLEGISSESQAGVAALNSFGICESARDQADLEQEFAMGKLTKTLACNFEASAALGESFPRVVSQTFFYDKNGNVTKEVDVNRYIHNSNRQVQETRSEFDVENRLIKRTLCGGIGCEEALSHVESYEYDQQGRIRTVADKAGNAFVENHFNRIGQLSRQSLGGGILSTDAKVLLSVKDYHLHGWVRESNVTKMVGGALQFDEKLFFEDGVQPRFGGSISGDYVRLNASIPSLTDMSRSFTYDDLGRLASAVATPANSGGGSSYEYLDDDRLSVINQGGSTGQYAYQSGGRLKSVTGNLVPGRDMSLRPGGGSPFDFDLNGNLYSDHSKEKDGQPLEIFYREDNLPYLFIYKVPGAVAGTYSLIEDYMVYDGSGNRVSKIEYAQDIWTSTKSYTSFGKEIREPANQSAVEFYSLLGLGRISYPTGTPNGKREFYLQDHLGSSRGLYDYETGNIASSSHYHPYGKEFSGFNSASQSLTPKFTGKEKDDGIGLSYFGARFYDADIALWISPDPAAQFANPYAYSSDPINLTDDDGLEAVYRGEKLEYMDMDPLTDQASYNYPDAGKAGPPERIPWTNESVGSIMDDFWRGNGSSDRDIISGPIVNSLLNMSFTWNSVDEYRKTGKTKFSVDFGLWEVTKATAAVSLPRHFLGSFDLTISPDPSGKTNLVFRNTTGLTSGTRGMRPGHLFDRHYSLLKDKPAGSGQYGNINERFMVQLSH
jgi:RHS repeat-associated protein